MVRKVIWVLMIFSLLLTSCGLETSGLGHPIEVWLESPLPGSGEIGMPLGQNLPIYGHARLAYGDTIRSVVLLVNGTAFLSLTLTREGENLFSASGIWTPAAEGTYKLRLRGFTNEGNQSDSSEVRVKVTYTPMLMVTPTPTSVATLPVLLTMTSTTTPSPSPTMPFTPLPSPSKTATKVPSHTPWPPISSEFWADRTSLIQGECTQLHWRVKHAASVLLNNKSVPAYGDQKICPAETSGYDLLAKAPSGDVLREITIKVTIPRDTTPPPIPNLIQPGNANANHPPLSNCIPLQWQAVTDPSGVTYNVELQKKVGGAWNIEAEWNGLTNTSINMGNHCALGWQYRWRVRARDNAGNQSDWSIWFYFDTPIL